MIASLAGGELWYDAIVETMDRVDLAILLISEDYLESAFVRKEEVPFLLKRREKEGMFVVPILLHPCKWQQIRWLRALQLLPRDNQSLSQLSGTQYQAELSNRADYVADLLLGRATPPHLVTRPKWAAPDQIDISRLPVTGAELFGRDAELNWLDDAWGETNLNVISLVAWGGVGKSTLVRKWVESLEQDHYRGARRVYAWSFYSQGTGKQVTTTDLFIDDALRFFGDSEPERGTAWDKGERLAALIRYERALLLLDPLEPLQSDIEDGRIKDPALSTLVQELARENPGMCVITTRAPVADLHEFADSTAEHDLEQISSASARALMRVSRVRGTDVELEAAAVSFGNHALAVNLLARYLRDSPNHSIAHAGEVPDLDIPENQGRHPQRVMAAFAARFGEGPELELLRVLRLFDRPAYKAELAAVCGAPAIAGLTDHLVALSEANWLSLLSKLRESGLLAAESTHQRGALDAHPLVREHFRVQLQAEHSDAFREGHDRIFVHLSGAAKEYPEKLNEMEPLLEAILHACAAGRHRQALYRYL